MDWTTEGDTMKAHGANGRVWVIRQDGFKQALHLCGAVIARDRSRETLKRQCEDAESAIRKNESEETHQEAQKDEPAEAEGYWMVDCPEEGGPMNSYGSEDKAVDNAEYIAKNNPGKSVYILKAVHRLKATTTVESVPCVAKE